MHKVVNTVCSEVTRVAGTKIDTEQMCRNDKKPSFAYYLAKSFVFYVLHDRMGMSYGNLATFFGMSISAVIRSIRSVRQNVFVYDDYTAVYKGLSEKFEWEDE